MNDEVNEQKKTKEQKLMEMRLFNLKSNENWLGIKKYIEKVSTNVLQMISSANPINDPYNISLNQGIMHGLRALQTYVEELTDPEEEAEDEDKQ